MISQFLVQFTHIGSVWHTPSPSSKLIDIKILPHNAPQAKKVTFLESSDSKHSLREMTYLFLGLMKGEGFDGELVTLGILLLQTILLTPN